MESKGNSRRWIVLGLLVLGVVVVATLPRSGTDETESETESETAPAEASGAQEDPTAPAAAARKPDGGQASRRIAEGCEPVEESVKYKELIGQRAQAVLSWYGISERVANLKIPVHVVGIEDGAVGVRFMQFPMREQYIGIWLGTGHVKPGPKDTFLLDPCSATIIAWPEKERGE